MFKKFKNMSKSGKVQSPIRTTEANKQIHPRRKHLCEKNVRQMPALRPQQVRPRQVRLSGGSFNSVRMPNNWTRLGSFDHRGHHPCVAGFSHRSRIWNLAFLQDLEISSAKTMKTYIFVDLL